MSIVSEVVVEVVVMRRQRNPGCTYILLHVLTDDLGIHRLLLGLTVLSSVGLLCWLLGYVPGRHAMLGQGCRTYGCYSVKNGLIEDLK